MKKIFTFLLLAGSCLTAFSQEKGNVEFGFNIGYNLATVQAGTETNSEYRSGVNIGGYADFYLSNSWSIKAKLTYDQKGWNSGTFTNLNTGDSYRTNFHFDYLTIPVVANWHFGRTKNWYLNFGPYAGFLLSANETAGKLDLKDYSTSVDAGLVFGMGVKIPVSSKVKVLLEFDGQAGFSDLVKDNQGTTLKNYRTAFNTGLAFSL